MNSRRPARVRTRVAFEDATATRFKRFSEIQNLLYTDGNEWALYRSGERAGAIGRFSGDITVDGLDAVSPEDARAVEYLLRKFLAWEPFLPLDRRGKIDLNGFAALLAPQCRMLRADVTEALSHAHSSLTRLATDWREWLCPAATDAQFADAYAKTVAFALLGWSRGSGKRVTGRTRTHREGGSMGIHSVLDSRIRRMTNVVDANAGSGGRGVGRGFLDG